MNIKLKLESPLKGGYPIRECIDFWIFSKLDFYDELIDLIVHLPLSILLNQIRP